MSYLHVNHPTQTTIDDLRSLINVKTDIGAALYFSVDSAVSWVKELTTNIWGNDDNDDNDDNDGDECPYDDQYIVKGLAQAVAQIEAWLSTKPEGWIVEYCEEWGESCSKSWERCDGEWRGQPGQLEADNCTAFMQLFERDNFCYLLAATALGTGIGFWEIFNDFPQINTIV